MTRRVQRVAVHLDAKGIRSLSIEEIRAILRGADNLIMRGGRNLLVKILKGSRSKDVIELGLDACPSYGFYQGRSDEEVLARIDWLILNGYLRIEYDYRLPLLIFTPKGWEIEKETYADELLHGFDVLLATNEAPYDMTYLKDKDRNLIWLLLDKVEATKNKRYVPLLEAWAEVDYKKVRARIEGVVQRLNARG
jgi:hypothetical protein